MAGTDMEAPIDPTLRSLLGRIPVAVALLDEDRDVVFGQDRLLGLVGADQPPREGFRAPGDLVGCVNALAAEGGCGTSEACALCGAYCAITRSQKHDEVVTRECRIRYRGDSGEDDLDLTVTAAPYETDGHRYTLLTVQDASDEKRRRALERVFFHDLTNIAGGLAGLAAVLRAAQTPEEQQEMLDAMEHSARSLLDEISAQRQLAEAESGDLRVEAREVASRALLQEVAETLRFHPVGEGRTIAVAPDAEVFAFEVDPTLLRRVLINIAKNALEASARGETVTLDCAADADTAVFRVHNPGVIPAEVQHQLFQRSFSTKGTGRGLGTYSVRLLTDRYLGGAVSFTSDERDGTFFAVRVPIVSNPITPV
ncbi:MAG: sensor histidine kinase [Spirochaetota bacterium]